jgi:uroporphyrinogen III methyltransferase/synthase
VEAFMNRLQEKGHDPVRLADITVLAVGEKTAEALMERGVEPEGLPAEFRTEGLAQILAGMDIRGDRFLLPRAQEARELLPRRIEELGGEVTVAPLYRTVPADPDTPGLVNFHRAGMVDVLTFTSGSTFRFFMEILGPSVAREIFGEAKLACIGPVTAEVVREAGFRVDIVPARSTVDDLVTSMEEHFKASDREKTEPV